MTRTLLAAAAVALLVAVPAVAQRDQRRPSLLPAGPGREIVAVACTQCHAPTAFTNLREDADAWRHQVLDMVLRGAQVGPGDLDKVVSYLATNFGPGINTPPPVHPVTLPAGAGKVLVEQDCALCHGLDRVVAVKRSRQGWTEVLKRMAFYGAPLSAKDEETIAAYLDNKVGAATKR